ncbi:glycosyltransferase [Harryflintia acetispora]|uniref:glycosyltransferase n=1 Tax=Harryflintia acetispora TaxID=1849041 RepID=UPI0018990DE7
MDTVKVSVVLPTYKNEEYLVQCIESILNQTLEDIELIVVDEGDLDRGREIIDYYEKADPRVKSIHEKNGGYGKSVNKGFAIAQGEYWAIVEADDFLEPTMYQELYEYAKRLGADVVKSSFYEHFPNGKRIYSRHEYLNNHLPSNRTFTLIEFPQFIATHPSIWGGIYKASFMKENDIHCVEAKGAGYIDGVFRLDVMMNAKRIAWLNNPLYNYRLTNEAASSAPANYNLSAMLHRWSEVHERLSKRQKLRDIIGPFLAREEYVNTIEWIYGKGKTCTEDDLKLLKQNLVYVEENYIRSAPILTEQEKSIMLGFKNNVDLFVKQSKRHMNISKYKNYIREITVKLTSFKMIGIFSCALIVFVPFTIAFYIGAYDFLLLGNSRYIVNILLSVVSLLFLIVTVSCLFLKVLYKGYKFWKFKRR